ncbi:MAG: hypothetical protein ACI867_000424, partial [Glaciecola sp.]
MSESPAASQLTLHVDSWSPDYATQAAVPGGGPLDAPPVDPNVELPTSQWEPISPTSPPAVGDVLFID